MSLKDKSFHCRILLFSWPSYWCVPSSDGTVRAWFYKVLLLSKQWGANSGLFFSLGFFHYLHKRVSLLLHVECSAWGHFSVLLLDFHVKSCPFLSKKTWLFICSTTNFFRNDQKVGKCLKIVSCRISLYFLVCNIFFEILIRVLSKIILFSFLSDLVLIKNDRISLSTKNLNT